MIPNFQCRDDGVIGPAARGAGPKVLCQGDLGPLH
jgi:hypothetical protein